MADDTLTPGKRVTLTVKAQPARNRAACKTLARVFNYDREHKIAADHGSDKSLGGVREYKRFTGRQIPWRGRKLILETGNPVWTPVEGAQATILLNNPRIAELRTILEFLEIAPA